jgi:hypothetical protein
VNLTGSNLDRANLDFALLIDGLLGSIRLVDASLVNAVPSGARLANAIIGRANLMNANLIGANLAGASFLQSDLSGANLSDVDRTGASLSNATLSGATLEGALYDEHTLFPSGGFYDSPPWDLDALDSAPWNRGMIPTPEPSTNCLLLVGSGALGGLARLRRRAVARTTRQDS